MIRPKTTRRLLTVSCATALALLAGCGGGAGGPAPSASEPSPAPAAPEAEQREVRPAQALPLPGESPAKELPPGHPPVDSAPAAGELVWTVPASWVEVDPASSMRIAQYTVRGPGGDAECIVFYFGRNQGGGAMANAQRWAGQFAQPDGGSSLERMKVSELDGATVAVQVVEVTGTYDGGMTMTSEPARPKPGYMLLGGIAEGPDAPWFFKFTGPEATVRAEREQFLALLRSVRVQG